MYIFSSSTRNQHPNHGVVAGAEKPRRRKKETPATATSSENQERIVYVNGYLIGARPLNKIGEYAELVAVTRDSVKADEEEFLRVVESRIKDKESRLSTWT